MLEPVEDLLEGELNPRQDSAMSARDFVRGKRASGERDHCRARRDKQRKMRDDQPKTDYSTSRRSHRSDKTAGADPTRSAGVEICVEPHHHP